MPLLWPSTPAHQFGLTLYDQLHQLLHKKRNRRPWAVLLLLLWVLLSVMLFLMWYATLRWVENVYLSTVVATTILCLLIFWRFASENINRSTEDRKFISWAFDYLCIHRPLSATELHRLDKRAEIGMNAGQLRTLFHLLIIPVAIPLAIQAFQITVTFNKPMSVYSLLFLGGGLLIIFIVSFSFFGEIDRSNRDAIIRHAIVEFTDPKNHQRLQLQQEAQDTRHLLKRSGL